MELSSPPRIPLPARFLAVAGGVACVLLSVLPPSSSRLLMWPWSLLTVAFWALAALAGLVALLGRSRLPSGLERGLVLLALASAASAYLSPFRGVSIPAAWVAVGACLLPFALLPWFGPDRRETTVTWIGWSVLAVLAASIGGWILLQVMPARQRGATWLQALGERNDQPFGHANYGAAFALFAFAWMMACLAPWLASRWGRIEAGAASEDEAPSLRGEWALGALLALVVLLTSGSRAGIGALALGVGAGLAVAWRHGRARTLRAWRGAIVVAVALLLLGVLSNGRLRGLVLEGRWNASASESNQQRLAMTQGALQLGAARPALGWGPGAVPHIFPSVREHLPGTADNVLQVHNSVLQAWATLGALGAVGAVLVALGGGALVRGQRSLSLRPADGFERAALVGGLVSGAAFSCFDHAFDLPAIAGLAGATLAALASPAPAEDRPGGNRGAAVLAGVALLALVPGVWREQQARHQHSLALDAAGARDADGYRHHLAAASALLPAATYLDHLLAGQLATGEPFGGPVTPAGLARAADLLVGTLNRNPSLEYAHYNLGWLRLDGRPAEAERHFAAAARLAPHRIGVHLGLGLARAAQGDTPSAVRAFAAERVNAPDQAFASLFRDPSLAALAREVEGAATAFLREARQAGTLPAPAVDAVLAAWAGVTPEQVQESVPFRRVRPGYGLLMGFPEGRPPADVNPMTVLRLPPAIARTLPSPGWVPGRRLLELSLRPGPSSP